jgi:hypothetical protein
MHSWDYVGDLVADRDPNTGIKEYHRIIQCVRCQTQRVDVFRVEHNLVRPHRRTYKYPKGYRVPGGLSKAEARALMFFPRKSRRR